MANKDYYSILGVDRNATEEQIKSAYKKLALKWHPDRHANESEDKKKEAYDIITQYTELEIRKTPQDIESIKKIDVKKSEMIMILTNNAIDYYEDHKKEITEFMNKNQIKCEFYKWNNMYLSDIK